MRKGRLPPFVPLAGLMTKKARPGPGSRDHAVNREIVLWLTL
jgi:hypothetical protein